MRAAPAALLAFALLTTAAGAQATFYTLWNQCGSREGSDRTIAACRQLRGAEGLEPLEYALVELDIAAAYHAKSDNPHALEALDKALTLEPNLWTAYVDRIYLRLEGEEVDAALDDYAKLMRIDPSKIDMRVHGMNYGHESADSTAPWHGDRHETAEHASAIVRIKRELAHGLSRRAAASYGAHQYQKAIADLDSANALAPGVAGVLYLRGVVKRQSGDIAGADADRSAALALDPKTEEQAIQTHLIAKPPVP